MDLKKSAKNFGAKEKIYNALMYLLKHKNFTEIFVKDICTIACIHRSSFYEHYQDINDLMMQVESELSKSIAAIFKDTKPFDRDSFIAFFSFIKEHKEFYCAYLNSSEERHMGRTDFTKWLKQEKNVRSSKDIEFHMAFFAGGLQALCTTWILTNFEKTPEQLADIVIDEYKDNAKYFATYLTEKL